METLFTNVATCLSINKDKSEVIDLFRQLGKVSLLIRCYMSWLLRLLGTYSIIEYQKDTPLLESDVGQLVNGHFVVTLSSPF